MHPDASAPSRAAVGKSTLGQSIGNSMGRAATAAILTLCSLGVTAQDTRDLRNKKIPVPDTVSPQMQKLIAAPLTPTWNVIPKTAEEWKAQVKTGVEAALQMFEGQSHAHYYRDVDAPETREAVEEIARFFDKHLGG